MEIDVEQRGKDLVVMFKRQHKLFGYIIKSWRDNNSSIEEQLIFMKIVENDYKVYKNFHPKEVKESEDNIERIDFDKICEEYLNRCKERLRKKINETK